VVLAVPQPERDRTAHCARLSGSNQLLGGSLFPTTGGHMAVQILKKGGKTMITLAELVDGLKKLGVKLEKIVLPSSDDSSDDDEDD